MKHQKHLKHTLATCMYMQHLDLLLQHPDEMLATYVRNRFNIWDIHLKTSLQYVQLLDLLLQHRYKHLQHTSKIFEILEIDACNMQFQRNISLLFGRMDPHLGVWSSILAVVGCTRASSTPATTNWVGGCEMCMGGLRPGCCELHVGELYT